MQKWSFDQKLWCMNLEERTFGTPCIYALVIWHANLFIQAKQNRYLFANCIHFQCYVTILFYVWAPEDLKIYPGGLLPPHLSNHYHGGLPTPTQSDVSSPFRVLYSLRLFPTIILVQLFASIVRVMD